MAMMWPFNKRRSGAEAFRRAAEEWEAWQQPLYQQGYMQWRYTPPPEGIWIEGTRREWATHRVWQTGKEPREMNVADLWWRPWRGETIEQEIIDGG